MIVTRAEQETLVDLAIDSPPHSRPTITVLGPAGFDRAVLAQMINTLNRFDDDEIPLAAEEVPLARAFFAGWAGELR